MPSRLPMIPSAAAPARWPALSRGPPTPGRGYGVTGRYRRSCCRATMRRSPGGGATARCAKPRAAGPTSSPGWSLAAWQCLAARQSLAARQAGSTHAIARCYLTLAFRLAAKIWHTESRSVAGLLRRGTAGRSGPAQIRPDRCNAFAGVRVMTTEETAAMHTAIAELEQAQIRSDIPDFRPGDTLKVHVRVVEGSRSRIQVFQGVVIRRQGGGVRETFTVRKISYGVGVERTFPLHTPAIDKIEVVTRGRVRRAKLYYLRSLRGKAARIRERRDLSAR